MSVEEDNQVFNRDQISEKYVAFVDILGFGARVLYDFDGLLNTFEDVLHDTVLLQNMKAEVELLILSDSFLLVSRTLAPLIVVTQALHMQTLFNDHLVRGGIAYGRHIALSRPPHLFMVSEAMVRAAAIEQSVKFPCVRIHPDIEIPDKWWRSNTPNINRGILYFGGYTIVNPCNLMWGQSAATRVSQMLVDSPEHREKYEWFLEMHQAIFSPVPMVPPRFLTKAT